MRNIHPLSSEGRRIARTFRKLETLARIWQTFEEANLSILSIEAFAADGLSKSIEAWRRDEPLSCWELSARTSNSLKVSGITTYRELLEKTERELLRCPNFGRKCLNEINDELVKRGGKLKDGPKIGAG